MRQWRTDGSLLFRWIAALALFGAIAAASPNRARAEPPLPVTSVFSQAKLDRIGDYFRNEVLSGKIPGAVVLIQQHGRPAYFESFGRRDVATGQPMTADSIFRFYSMSKPVTSVTAMMLVDDGRLKLDDPLSKYIPAFADVKVAVAKPVE
jgi:CubicO group peptidase (beta-lactamase class C family)